MSYPKKNWPVADDILIELGRLSSCWNGLEIALNRSITKLSGAKSGEPIPYILTAHSSFPQRLDIFGTLCELQFPSQPQLENYKKVINKIKHVQGLRNKYIHNAISYVSEENVHKLAVASARQSLKVLIENVDSNVIFEACKEIHFAHIELHNLVNGTDQKSLWDK